MPVDVVVVNYHTPDDLEQFVESLERHPPKAAATLTIVEVDAGEDYTHNFTWADGLPGRTIGFAANVGYARACNRAAADGEADTIALFNADIVLCAGAIDECDAALHAGDDWAVIGPRQVDPAGRIRHAGIFGSHEQPVHRGWNEHDRGQYQDVREAVTVSGSAYFVKRTVWDELTACPLFQEIAPDTPGAFLPTSHYYEETWCSYHAVAHGHKVVYFGPTTVVHKWHRASPVGGEADRQMPMSQQYFRAACEHHGILHD